MESLKIYELCTDDKVIIYNGDNYIEDYVVTGTGNGNNLGMWIVFKGVGSMFSIDHIHVYKDTPKLRTKLLIQNIQIKRI